MRLQKKEIIEGWRVVDLIRDGIRDPGKLPACIQEAIAARRFWIGPTCVHLFVSGHIERVGMEDWILKDETAVLKPCIYETVAREYTILPEEPG